MPSRRSLARANAADGADSSPEVRAPDRAVPSQANVRCRSTARQWLVMTRFTSRSDVSPLATFRNPARRTLS